MEYQGQGAEIHTLERGQLPSETINVHDLKKMLKQSPKSKEAWEKSIKEMIDAVSEKNHSGIYSRVVFKIDRSISLRSLGFWGPHKEEDTEYHVSIIVSRLSSLCVAKQKTTIVSKFQAVAQARRGGIFFVDLNRAIPIPEGSWTQIEFQLNGPSTFRSEKLIHECRGPGVTFTFSDSSLQMPVIKYQLL